MPAVLVVGAIAHSAVIVGAVVMLAAVNDAAEKTFVVHGTLAASIAADYEAAVAGNAESGWVAGWLAG